MKSWSVWEIGRGQFFAAPDSTAAIVAYLEFNGFDQDTATNVPEPVLVNDARLLWPVVDQRTGDVLGTIADARDIAQEMGTPMFICRE